MQNFEDMQKLLRQKHAPAASNGGLSTPSSLDLAKCSGQSYDELNQFGQNFK